MARFMQKVSAESAAKGTKGALRRQMGAKKGQKIPDARLHSEAARLAAKAKKGKLSPDELKLSRRVQMALRYRGK